MSTSFLPASARSSACSAAGVSALIVAAGLVHVRADEPAAKPANPSTEKLPGTKLMTGDADMHVETVNHANRFLDKALDRSIAARAKYWKRDFSSPEAYAASVEPNRQRSGHDRRRARSARHAAARRIFLFRHDAQARRLRHRLHRSGRSAGPLSTACPAKGLLLEPTAGEPAADVVVVPDCAQTPEMTVGLSEGIAEKSQLARRLAENGCRVIVPALIDRQRQFSTIAHGTKKGEITHRELLNRAAYQMGRTVVGLEMQKIVAAIDWFSARFACWQPVRPSVARHWRSSALEKVACWPCMPAPGHAHRNRGSQRLFRLSAKRLARADRS